MKQTRDNTVIAISGASHSGKTTFIDKMTNTYPEYIKYVGENIRDHNLNIDEIRKNPSKYLDLEIDIINAKIDNEEKYNNSNKNKIILVDRSLVDSYFYYTFYMDKSYFSYEDKKKYYDFLTFLKMKMYHNVNNLYNYIFMFEPIHDITRNDNFTVNNIEQVQDNEYFFIKTFTIGISQNQRKVLDVNPNIASVIIKTMMDQVNENH